MEGRCHFCGSSIKDDKKLSEIKKQKEESEALIIKGEAAIESRKKKRDEASLLMTNSSKPLEEAKSEISRLRETLKRLDDGSVIDALKKTLEKNTSKLNSLKEQLKNSEQVLTNYKDKVIISFEKEINDDFKTVYFKKEDVMIVIVDNDNKRTSFDIKFYGRSFNSLCGEETIFAKMEIAANIGAGCILIDGLESGGDDDMMKKFSKDLGVQIIGTRRIQAKKVTKKPKNKTEDVI